MFTDRQIVIARGVKMKVSRIGPLIYTVSINPAELGLLQKDVLNPPDWPVKDPASLLQYVLERHLEYCEVRYNLCK